MKQITGFLNRHIFLTTLIFVLSFTLIFWTIEIIFSPPFFSVSVLNWSFPLSLIIFGIPLGLSLFNIYSLIMYKKIKGKGVRIIEIIALALGGFYTLAYLEVLESVMFKASYDEQLYDLYKHPPLNHDNLPTLLVVIIMVAIAYIFLSFTSAKKVPMLTTILSISVLYLGGIVCILFIIQVVATSFISAIFPINYLILLVKMIIIKTNEYKEKAPLQTNKKFFCFIDRLLRKNYGLPFLALMFLLPVLVVFILILLLCNQQPDSLIKLFTETSEWQLSTHVALENRWN